MSTNRRKRVNKRRMTYRTGPGFTKPPTVTVGRAIERMLHWKRPGR